MRVSGRCMGRNKWLLWLIVLLAFGLAACTSPEDLLTTQLDALPQDDVLLYKHTDTASGATGQCVGLFQDRWYGTALNAEEVVQRYVAYFPANGWQIWPSEVVEIWSQEDEAGLYRVSTTIYANLTDIDQEQGHYQLPDSLLLEAAQYQTIYLLSMTYMTPYAAEKCFGHLNQ